jgi:hypothetical protein
MADVGGEHDRAPLAAVGEGETEAAGPAEVVDGYRPQLWGAATHGDDAASEARECLNLMGQLRPARPLTSQRPLPAHRRPAVLPAPPP